MSKGMYVGVNGIAQKVKKMYVGTGPVTYSEVEYIQSSGAQYIDTGHTWTSENVKVEMGFEYLSLGANSLFGSETTSSGKYSIVPYVDTTSVSFYVGSSTKLCSVPVSINTHYDLICAAANGTLSITTNGSVSSGAYSGSVQNGRSIAVFANNHVNGVTQHSSLKLKYCRMYDNGTLVRDFVPCQTSTGAIGLYDKVESKFYSNAGSGTFTAGAEIETIKTTGIARKVKKGYIGVGGVARPFFSGGELAYYGTATSLSFRAEGIASITHGNRALFGGGYNSGTNYTKVDTYDKSLTMATLSSGLLRSRAWIETAKVGDYALFAGGGSSYGTSKTGLTYVDAFDASLVRTNPDDLYSGVSEHGAATLGDYAIFAYGRSGDTVKNYLTAYDASLTRSYKTSIGTKRYAPGTASIGNYAIFVGGLNSSDKAMTDVQAFNTSLTSVTATAIAQARGFVRGVTIGNHALFVGGDSSKYHNSPYADVDAYDASLTRTVPTSYPQKIMWPAVAVLGDYAVFAGGQKSNGSGYYQSAAVAYDTSLTRTVLTNLAYARSNLAGASIGDYALFAGGEGGGYFNYVEAFVLA